MRCLAVLVFGMLMMCNVNADESFGAIPQIIVVSSNDGSIASAVDVKQNIQSTTMAPVLEVSETTSTQPSSTQASSTTTDAGPDVSKSGKEGSGADKKMGDRDGRSWQKGRKDNNRPNKGMDGLQGNNFDGRVSSHRESINRGGVDVGIGRDRSSGRDVSNGGSRGGRDGGIGRGGRGGNNDGTSRGGRDGINGGSSRGDRGGGNGGGVAGDGSSEGGRNVGRGSGSGGGRGQ